MNLSFYNTLTGKKEEFSPKTPGKVLMYNCGPTVYGLQHIGNLSMFVFTDILRKTLELNNLQVNQVINITDFGHLSGDNEGDADLGEDRMSKGLRNEGLELNLDNMKVFAKKYADLWMSDLEKLNIPLDKITFPFASDYIPEQIELIKKLEEKGFTYTGEQGVYFDTNKFPDYGKLGNIDLEGLQAGARVKNTDTKKNTTDFLLWKFDSKLGWQSPWGLGFPGWHIECTAMIFKILGEQIDIHTGGIEHIAIHHNNEIAQAEAASGKTPFSKFWLHRQHLRLDNEKFSKSTGNVIYLKDIIEKGYDPLAFRYLLLTGHYKTPTNFTWEALNGAQTALNRLRNQISLFENIDAESIGESIENNSESYEKYLMQFKEFINDDLNTPQALALVWKILKDLDIQNLEKYKLVKEFDKVLGLQLDKKPVNKAPTEIPEEVQELITERDQARTEKDFTKSDELRKQIERFGFEVMDTPEGTKVKDK
jgi:cysteinyl-tRNA synthetase